MVRRSPSPTDRRRKTFHLTDEGRTEAERFERYCEEAAEVFRELYEEIGFDLAQVLEEATRALESRSLVRRFPYSEV